jgi:hypothetical protein
MTLVFVYRPSGISGADFCSADDAVVAVVAVVVAADDDIVAVVNGEICDGSSGGNDEVDDDVATAVSGVGDTTVGVDECSEDTSRFSPGK